MLLRFALYTVVTMVTWCHMT